jgi:hypothetical protein
MSVHTCIPVPAAKVLMEKVVGRTLPFFCKYLSYPHAKLQLNAKVAVFSQLEFSDHQSEEKLS